MSFRMQSGARADIYTRITAEIIAAVEQGAGEWRAPWFHDGTSVARPTNVASGKRYRGINTVALWVAATASHYSDGLWGTYRQWRDAGAQVRKGERATTVVLWKQVAPSEPAEDDDDDNGGHRRMFAKAFSVFNVAQVDGYERPPTNVLPESERLAHAEAFIANLGIKTVFGGSEAYYLPSSDAVFMPDFASFRDVASFYAVWLHEDGHASGAKHRLDRDLSGRFGSAAYAAEECCVEILSGLVLADLGIAHYPRPDHAAYITSWIEVLKDDPRAIFTAASKAQQAADWMHAQQPVSAEERQTSSAVPDETDAYQSHFPLVAGTL
ncbi:ArdC family protein [Bradyrhizobium elkanii]|uniref:ArdC family protein n=1 Tax=Bradyrhizobium elkanii TaxID=29448 RepID=UPI00144903A3|nr:zincin-like metallopeptidase domain-containing protein [Bradyrhizobium elkanii]MCP1927723.1 antirestriction protein ArdC [Bradyrhizobium elkanii]MCS3581668.1 antirestriction protein ArdC [Bradyrhizobium elkanii]MCS3724542.1 antirestriction protein ArdC [Bradyrhizobium elkanii]MCS4008954.1 antirestriction protein ArdC [Bradyrhizobium elkanii USDA 61]WLA40789.1 zincin-like metallopeptidase domain-containing protein [Bradyrhizobium elkanii]